MSEPLAQHEEEVLGKAYDARLMRRLLGYVRPYRRMAFGALPGQVVRTMMRDAALPIVIGTLVGVGGALAATRVIESFLFATAPRDPFTLAAVAVTLAAAGCLAALVPAMRAAKVDPMVALRYE